MKTTQSTTRMERSSLASCAGGEVWNDLAIAQELADGDDVSPMEMLKFLQDTFQKEKGMSVRRVFLAGVHEHHSEIRLLNALLQRENAQHNDVLQWNFYDTFFNLTVKQLLFFDWLNQSCQGVSYIFDGDDDVFVNVDNLMQFLLNQQRQQHLYTGMVIVNAAPILNQHSKYYVPHQIQAKNKYPSYVSGGGIIMSMWTAMQIRVAALSLPILPIDDVFLGQCLELLGLKPQYHHGFRTSGINLPGKHINSFHPCYYREMLLVHRLLPYQMLPMWEAVQDPKLRCGNPL
uniref:Hexosyltransferase n=1 Tax=Eptatretus burgeri TaxID=7764 RepID=A0A8C4RBC7_EPTBU